MIYSSHSFTLNLHDSAADVYLRIKNGDTARSYSVTLIDGDIVYRISPDCYARLTGKTPSGDIINTNCRIIDNKIVFNLTPSVSASIGLTECEIRLYSQNDEMITSPRFMIQSEPSLYQEVAPDPPVYSGTVITLSLPSYAWVGEGSPWSQVAMVDNATAHSQVNLQPTQAQLTEFKRRDMAFTTKNENGSITVYAIGDKPLDDITIQATLIEVK